MTKPTTEPKTIEHVDPAKTSLPSLHVDHAAVFRQELETRLLGFDTGISALHAEMEGAQKQFDREQAERAAEHAAFIEQRHILKRNLERARHMTLAAQAAYADDIPADIEEEQDNG